MTFRLFLRRFYTPKGLLGVMHVAPLWTAAGVFASHAGATFWLTGRLPKSELFYALLISAIACLMSLLFVLLASRHAAARQAHKQQIVLLMNHHIRNALQSLCRPDLPEEQQAEMRDAFMRIDWALREVLGEEKLLREYGPKPPRELVSVDEAELAEQKRLERLSSREYAVL